MKSFVIVLGGVLACAGALSAQEQTTPRYEVGVLYSGTHLNAGQNNSEITGNGGAAYFEYNFNKWLGAVADFGGYANNNSRIDDKLFTYMFGPRLNWRHKRFNPYAQALFGGGKVWSNTTSTSQNTFAFAVGGGVDVALTHHIAIKPVQVEYFRTQFNSEELGGPTSNFGDHQNGIRYSAGVVFQFGAR
jgi:opacity protein-like surface antigen